MPMTDKQKLVEMYGQAIQQECLRAMAMHAPMNSAHEGYGVILEELDELWDEVRKRHPLQADMEREAVQLGAMAIRFLVDVVAGKRWG